MNDTLKAAGRIGAELGAAKAENERLRGLLHDAHDTIRNLAEDLDEEEFQVTIDQLAEIELALAPQQAEPCGTCEPEGIMATDGSGPFDCPDCGKKAAARNGSESAETRAVTGLEGAAQTTPDTYTAVDMATAAAQGFRDGQAAVEQAPAQDEREFNTSDSDLTELLNIAADMLKGVGGGMDLGIYFATVLERVEQRLATRPAQTEQQPVCWASSTALAKLQNGRNNSPCVLTDGPAEFNDTPLYVIAQTEQPEQSGLVEALRTEALGLCDVVEKINSLSPVTYALQAGRAINKVRDAAAALSAQWTAEQ